MSKIKAVLFDLDGTILDTEKLYTRFWKEAIEVSGYKIAEKDLLNLRSLSAPYAKKFFHEVLGPDAEESELRAVRRTRMKAYTDVHPIEKKPGAEETLAALKEKGILSAIVTASNLRRTTRYLTEVGLLGQFDKIITGDTFENGKPAPDCYISACEQLGIAPEEALAVEDAPNGVLSAYQAGCNVVMVPDLTYPDEETKKMLIGVPEVLTDVLEYCK